MNIAHLSNIKIGELSASSPQQSIIFVFGKAFEFCLYVTLNEYVYFVKFFARFFD